MCAEGAKEHVTTYHFIRILTSEMLSIVGKESTHWPVSDVGID